VEGLGPAPRRWQEDVGLVLWPSFLVASIETMAFFATFDPLALYEHAELLREAFVPRVFGYSVGFFFFWSLTASASALTLFLARSGRTPDGGGAP
jgi:hypothetical protein